MTFEEWIGKARSVRIEDEIARRGIKLRGGVDRCGPCPNCGGDDRFSINIKKQVFNCRGCGNGGDVIDLARHLDGVDTAAAATTLAGPRPNGKNGSAPHAAKPKKVTAATFEYHDEGGAVVFAVDRIEYQNVDGTFILKDGKRKKTFIQKRPDVDGWIPNVEGVTKVLYRLPELIEAVASGHLIFVVEGEACVDALREIGIAATTNSGGAGKWQPEFSEHLRGADVVLLPDNDEPGWKHVTDVASSLVGVAARVRVVLLPDLPEKGDVRDWIAAGGAREQLDALVDSAQDWQPPAPADEVKTKAASDEQALIDELSRLESIEYDRRRNEAADQIGIRRSTLDDQVNARRAQLAEEEGPPPLFGHCGRATAGGRRY